MNAKAMILLAGLSILAAAESYAAGDDKTPAVLRAIGTVEKGDPKIPEIVAERASRVGLASFDASALLPEKCSKGCVPVPGRTVTIEPFPGEVFQLFGERASEKLPGYWTWSASIAGDSKFAKDGQSAGLINTFLTLYDNGKLFGTMDTGSHHFTFITRNGNTWVREDDPDQYPIDEELPGKAPSAEKAASPKTTGTRQIDLLVYYTAATALRYDLSALVSTSAAGFDAAFSNTGVTGNINIAGVQSASYTESNPMDATAITALPGAMAAGSSPWTNVATDRGALNADLVMLIWDSSLASGTCGAGSVLLNTAGDSAAVYSDLGDGCISAFQNFTHEMGHNMGGRHDYLVTPNLYTYGHGYTRSTAPAFRDLMGSANGCSLSGCARQNFWSAPGNTYSGVATGVSGQSDMKKVLDGVSGGAVSTVELVADYETAGGGAPGAPGTTTITNQVCNGLNESSWVASSGTVGYYEAQLSTSGSYTSPYVIYWGSDNGFLFDVPGTRYFRVRACNGNGCSSWTNGNVAATVYPGCP